MNLPVRMASYATAMVLSVGGALAEEKAGCDDQARTILDRFQAEVVGKLSASQRVSANQIVLDACHDREAQVDVEVQEAVQQAREEEQEKASSWWKTSPDSEGNKRLKRKQH